MAYIDAKLDKYWGRIEDLPINEKNEELINNVKLNDINKVRLLIEHVGANMDTKDARGNTLIALAASLGHVKIVNLLLDMGVNPDVKNNTGETALMLAAGNGYNNVVKRLIEGGAKKDIRNDAGESAAECAEKGRAKKVSNFDSVITLLGASVSGAGGHSGGRRKRKTRKYRSKNHKRTKHRKSRK